jgi:gamma-glutamylcysteine synthetase
MFAEEDRGVQAKLAAAAAGHAQLLEQQEAAAAAMAAAASATFGAWASAREAYRVAQLLKVEAVQTLHAVGTAAVNLPEGLKATGPVKASAKKAPVAK